MNVDPNAAAHARCEMLIHAPVERVWRILSSVEEWPAWQPEVVAAQMEGDLRPGTTFCWKSKGMSISSRLHTVEPPHLLGWTGKALGMMAIHNWRLEARGDSTFVVSEESLSGWLTRVMVLFDSRFLKRSLETTLQRLKDKAEA